MQKSCREIKIVHKPSDKHGITDCNAPSVFPKCTCIFLDFQRYGLCKATKLSGKKKSRIVNTDFMADCWKLGCRLCKIWKIFVLEVWKSSWNSISFANNYHILDVEVRENIFDLKFICVNSIRNCKRVCCTLKQHMETRLNRGVNNNLLH